jgi:hypothetical protein
VTGAHGNALDAKKTSDAGWPARERLPVRARGGAEAVLVDDERRGAEALGDLLDCDAREREAPRRPRGRSRVGPR